MLGVLKRKRFGLEIHIGNNEALRVEQAPLFAVDVRLNRHADKDARVLRQRVRARRERREEHVATKALHALRIDTHASLMSKGQIQLIELTIHQREFRSTNAAQTEADIAIQFEEQLI